VKGLDNIYATFILDEEINELKLLAKLQQSVRAASGAVTARTMPAQLAPSDILGLALLPSNSGNKTKRI